MTTTNTADESRRDKLYAEQQLIDRSTFPDVFVEKCAHAAYESVRAVDLANGLRGIPHWEKADETTKREMYDRVKLTLNDPRGGDAVWHAFQVKKLKDRGWSQATVYDDTRKLDPALVAYYQLPPDKKERERLYRAVVVNLSQV